MQNAISRVTAIVEEFTNDLFDQHSWTETLMADIAADPVVGSDEIGNPIFCEQRVTEFMRQAHH